MNKVALAGAFALAVVGFALDIAQAGEAAPIKLAAEAQAGPVVTSAHIARLKAELKLTADQQRYWVPVEAALRDLARRHAAVAAGAPEAKRVMIVALPLIGSLNEEQKRKAMVMARSMGFMTVASAL